MKIIVVGCGKVGATIAAELYQEGHDITVIDQDHEVLKTITESIDVMSVETAPSTRFRWRRTSRTQIC